MPGRYPGLLPITLSAYPHIPVHSPTRHVAAEFPSDEVVVVDLTTRPEFDNRGCWVGVGDPHPSFSGHAVIAAACLDAVVTSKLSTAKKAGV